MSQGPLDSYKKKKYILTCLFQVIVMVICYGLNVSPPTPAKEKRSVEILTFSSCRCDLTWK